MAPRWQVNIRGAISRRPANPWLPHGPPCLARPSGAIVLERFPVAACATPRAMKRAGGGSLAPALPRGCMDVVGTPKGTAREIPCRSGRLSTRAV